MKRMKSLNELCNMNNIELLKWYKELKDYQKDLKNYALLYYDQCKLVQDSLQDRCNELQLTEIDAEYDRVNSDTNYFDIKTWIH